MASRELLRQFAEISERQQRLMEELARKETRVEGISLPHFSGAIGESVDLYFDHVMRFLAAKTINWEEEANGPRIVAMMTANFRGNAAAWYMLNRDKVHDIQELMHNLTKEFVPRDNQRRLRDKLYNLRQSRCQSLEDYIGKYRMLLMQIRDISELDKITYFTRGLLPQLGREVEHRHCDDISECFSVALEYDPLQSKTVPAIKIPSELSAISKIRTSNPNVPKLRCSQNTAHTLVRRGSNLDLEGEKNDLRA
ncbi:Gag/polymerase/env polyprotein, partial [Globisporangium splendens]